LTTVGLAAKNAFLIVEFAKEQYENGEDLMTAVSMLPLSVSAQF